MNLTKTQMDKITDAFTNKVNSSPGLRAHQAAVETTPTKSTSNPPRTAADSRPMMTYSLGSSADENRGVPSTPFSELMPQVQADGQMPDIFAHKGPSLPKRRNLRSPVPIQADASRIPGLVAYRPPTESVAHPVSPLRQSNHGRDSDGVSAYCPSAHLSDSIYLGQKHTTTSSQRSMGGPVVGMYNAWNSMGNTSDYPEPSSRTHNLAQRPRRSKSTSDGLVSDSMSRMMGPVHTLPPPPSPLSSHNSRWATDVQNDTAEGDLFSPLALYFRGRDFPTSKRGEKVMIGRNGWLERTERSPERGLQTTRKKRAGIIESIKKIAKDMTAEFANTGRRSQPSTREAASHIAISLTPREQSLLFCELEFHLTSALHDFITAELERGHLVADNLKSISDWWLSQGRPKVIGFRYDLETQLELVCLHVHDFNFYGRHQSNPVEIAGLLDAMKADARQIRVRTFCQPDSVIAKQLVDSQSLFNMINVSHCRQLGLSEIVQFFRVIVGREKQKREAQRTTASHPCSARNLAVDDSRWGRHRYEKDWQRQHGDQIFPASEVRYESEVVHDYDEAVVEPLPYARRHRGQSST
ncbi:hypothetical protein RJ55_07114 [Drechmeria coniospora]|nr:hypothetical protein RJ55_07114 [Drechmeria coniospora]